MAWASRCARRRGGSASRPATSSSSSTVAPLDRPCYPCHRPPSWRGSGARSTSISPPCSTLRASRRADPPICSSSRRVADGDRRARRPGARPRPPSTPGSRSQAAAIPPGRCGRLPRRCRARLTPSPDAGGWASSSPGEPVGASDTRGPSGDARERATWEADVAAACRAAAGIEPAANVCVYREADIRGGAPIPRGRRSPSSGRILTSSSRARTGDLGPRPAAIEAILTAVRPPVVGVDTWAELVAAAAVGLHRETATA